MPSTVKAFLDKKRAEAKFIESFTLLLHRFEKFEEISHKQKESKIEWYVFLDVIVVQMRALFFENESYKENYTIQNFLKSRGNANAATKLNKYFNQPFYSKGILDSKGKPLSIKNAIKFVADKFICHCDFTESDEIARGSGIEISLSNINNKDVNNIRVVLTNIIKIVGNNY